MSEAFAGTDKHRRLSIAERQQVYAGSGGICQYPGCGETLGSDWHVAHLNAYANGGATSVENSQAWCKRCNLTAGATDYGASAITPRDWQAAALPIAIDRIYETGVATIHAAPGAGKTFLAGFVFQQLRRAGLVDRMVVLVPNREALVNQWKDALGKLRIHLDPAPRDNVHELYNTVGPIATYQSLSDDAVKAHRARIDSSRTLVVLDEMHHLGEALSWGNFVTTMVGDVNAPDGVQVAGVLNMTGTLFRSSKDRRISTVRYREIAADKIEAIADYTINTAQLIQRGQLRKPVLYRMAGVAKVVDLREGTVTTGDIADLNKRKARVAIRQSFTSDDWLRGFVEQAMILLQNAQKAIGTGEALKMLLVASDQRAARISADMINSVAGRDFARLAISDQKDAGDQLKRAKRENHPCCIVTCQMVTEGFDHAPIAVLAYASHLSADLVVAQILARAMRVTETEKNLGKRLPAQALVPDNDEIVAAFENALIGQMHILEVTDDPPPPPPTRTWPPGPPHAPRFELIDLSSGGIAAANVLGEDDGEVYPDELNDWAQQLELLAVPVTYAPLVAVASRRVVKGFPHIYTQPDDRPTSQAPTAEPMNPRDYNSRLRDRLSSAVKWWYPHLDHSRFKSLSEINGQVNDVMGVKNKGRGDASPLNLQAGYAWVIDQIVAHCEDTGEAPPAWVGGDADDCPDG